MGKAFVSKLAREGARDPEALAAWIGRKKHGRKAFAKLAAKARKDNSSSSKESSGSATARQTDASAPAANGNVGAARSVHGARLYGEADRMRRAVERGSDRFTESATASPEDHDAVLARTSPSFRRKVQEARASGRPWLHQVGRDNLGAEIHTLEVEDASGKRQKDTFLERNSAAWNRLSSEERLARSEARMQGGDIVPLVPPRAKDTTAVRAKTLTREERIAVNRRARELTTEEGLRAADARTPSEAEATTRAQVLERRAIDKAAARGVTPAGADEVTRQQDADAIRRRDDRAPLKRVFTREQQERGRASVERTLAEHRRFEAEQKAARLAPATEQEQRDIERAAAGLVDRPAMLAQLDARLPQEADAETRREVIQRRAVDLARRRVAARI